jgi:hypothetical protein
MLNQERHWILRAAVWSFSIPLITRPDRRRSKHPWRGHPEIAGAPSLARVGACPAELHRKGRGKLGLNTVRGEWSFVTMAWNMKRMFALRPSA